MTSEEDALYRLGSTVALIVLTILGAMILGGINSLAKWMVTP